MSANTQDLIEENKRLKLEVETYLKGYENILSEKIKLEDEFNSYKLAIDKNKNYIKLFNPGESTVYNIQIDNLQKKSEIDEYLTRIFDLQTNLSQREEEVRVLTEKNKQLENQLNDLKKSAKIFTNDENNENHKEKKEKKSKMENSIRNINDLYKNTFMAQANKAVEEKVKQSLINKQKEEEEKKKKEEEEKKRLKELEELEKKKKLEEQMHQKQIQEKINNFLNIIKDQEKQLKQITEKSNEFYQETEKQFIFVQNYDTFINELNEEINSLKAQINISICGTEMLKKQQAKNNKIIEFTNSLETISLKIKQFSEILDDSKNKKLKTAENIQTEIQKKLNLLNNQKIDLNNKNSVLMSFKDDLELNTNFITMKLKELEQIIEILNSNKTTYENSKKSIEQDINKLKAEISEYIEKIKKAQSIILKDTTNIIGLNNNYSNNNNNNSPNIDSIFLRGSMLLGIKDFGKKDIFSSSVVFSEEDFVKKGVQDLIRKNWNEVCYVYDEYDIHDVHYELKAVGLPSNSFFSSCSIGFVIGSDIEILDFEKDGKKEVYDYSDYSLEFNIFLKNNESNQIHVKYKESPSKRKMTEGEKKERKFVKNDYYGLSKNLAGQRAKFVLCIKCGFEVICFEDEFLVKVKGKEKEYVWGGTVPPEGKRTLIKMSKSKAKYNFTMSHIIRSLTTQPIKNTRMTVPISFVGGNNEVIKIDNSSEQTNKINLNKEKRVYEIEFKDTNWLGCE